MDNILLILLVLLLGGVLAILYLNLKTKPKDEKEPAKESFDYAEAYAHLYEEYKQQQLDEIDIAGLAKKGAKASSLFSLVQHVKEKVYDKYEVNLEEEIQFIGEFT